MAHQSSAEYIGIRSRPSCDETIIPLNEINKWILDVNAEDSGSEQHRSTNTLHELHALVIVAFADFYTRNGICFGEADIFCIGAIKLDKRLADLLLVLLLGKDEREVSLVRKVVVILPPTPVSGVHEKDIQDRLEEAILRERGDPVTQEEVAVLKRRIQVVHTANLETSTAIAVLQTLEPNTVGILCNSAAYRDQHIVSFPKRERLTAVLEEDSWVPHLHAIASTGTQIARSRDLYVVFDAGEPLPLRTINTECLMSIDQCGLYGEQAMNDTSTIVAVHADEWVAQVRANRSDLALASIDALPETMNTYKPALKAQIFHQADRHKEALEIIRAELANGQSFDENMRTRFAHFALAANDHALARDLLFSSLPLLTRQESLELALTVSVSIRAHELEDECLQHLDQNFPLSKALYGRRIVQLLQASRAIGLGEKPQARDKSKQKDFAEFQDHLLSALSIAGELDYDGLLNEITELWENFLPVARLAFAVNSNARNQHERALSLAQPSELDFDSDLAMYSADILLDSIKYLILRRGKGELTDTLQQPVLELISYLSKNPQDAHRRLALTRILSVQAAGEVGLPVIALVTLTLTQQRVAIDQVKPSKTTETVSDDELERFFRNAIEWMHNNSPIGIGRTRLPAELVSGPVDGLMNALIKMVEQVVEVHGDQTDLEFLEQLSVLGALLAPHSSTPNEDIVFLRIAAGRFALAHQAQRARDFAEQALTLTRDDPIRSRLAWYTFADVYQRVHNLPEALVGMACALACEVEVTSEQAWYEANGLIRILRDLGLLGQARSFIPSARELLKRMDMNEKYAHRLDTVELAIRLLELSRATDKNEEEISTLVCEVELNCRRVLEQKDELMPATTLLSQAIHLCKFLNLPIEPMAEETLGQAMGKIGQQAVSLVHVASNSAPLAADVHNIAHSMEAARHSEDIGFDIKMVVLAAERLLASQEASDDSRVAVFAIELMSDHTIAAPQISEPTAVVTGALWLATSIESAGIFAEKLSREYLSVSLIGLDARDSLVHVTVQSGRVGNTVRENEATFSGERMRDWSKTYPYQYGIEKDIGNLFYTSMQGLGMKLPPSRRALVVMDTSLQQMPPNILMVNGELIGRTTAMASAPSLSWLSAIRAVRGTRNGRMSAWISTAENNESSGTLTMVVERLKPTLGKHGIMLDIGPLVPDGLKGSDLVIIAAHGGVGPEGRYFQVVADEAELKISPISLSQALENVGVVILFVCSGGRFDKHPLAATTVGLPKELLDCGCSAILASPWPLDSRVPSHWLPAFLDAWGAGEPVIDANFKANKAVETAMGNSPSLCLAMNLYGNPLVVKESMHMA